MTALGFRRWISSKRDSAEELDTDIVAVEVEPAPPEPERKAVVNERSARALLASGTPPLPADRQKAAPRWLEQKSEPSVESEAPAATTAAPRAWNIWELQRAVRASDDVERQEEWSALFIHLREFANAEGDLPVEFDDLVRESFGGVLESEPAS